LPGWLSIASPFFVGTPTCDKELTVEDHHRHDERSSKDASDASSDLQRLFGQSSFGSPQARQLYITPPPHLVSDVLDQIRTALASPLGESVTPFGAQCDTCGDCSNSAPGLRCGRLLGPPGHDDDHPDAVPCTGTYQLPT
jgi:hypothetical protein